MYKKIYKNMCFLSIFTLLLTAAIMISSFYSIYSNRMSAELKNEIYIAGNILNTSVDKTAALEAISTSVSNKRISLIDTDGNVIYDNRADISTLDLHSDRPEIIQAAKEGFGEAHRNSITANESLHYFALRLNDGMILRIATSNRSTVVSLISIIAVMLFLASLVYILSIIIAIKLTDNIVKPIENINLFDNGQKSLVYPEIQPFINRIENQQKEINRQLKKIDSQKFRLKAITTSMNEGLIITDKDKNIISLNNYTLNLFSANEYNYRQKKLSDITDNIELISCIEKALNGDRNDIIIKLGTKTYQIFSSPVYEGKKIDGSITLLFDISTKAETELIRREFSANVSHELKTPLTSIHGYAQIITSGIARSEDIIGFAKKIEKESSRLIVLIEDIIKLSRLDENRNSYDKENIHLKPIAEEVCENLAGKAKEKDIVIIPPSDDTLIFANRTHVEEMIYNLCDNAIKYNKIGGRIFIEISDKQISIKDTGIGICEEDIKRIFERFYRVDKSHSKKVNGTGLGLSIVKHLAQANNALISVESVLGEGSKFNIKFE